MKPIMLHGHERSITQIKYNREGDLLFSASKDQQPNVWYSVNGERLGSFVGHGGAVWTIDVNWDSTQVLTGSADNSCRIWDCETGSQLHTLETRSAVRSCGFSYSGNLIAYTTDQAMGYPSELKIYDIRDEAQIRNNDPYLTINMPPSKALRSLWNLDDMIVTGHDNGDLCQWDVKSGDLLRKVSHHNKTINDLQKSKDGMMLITASKDHTSKLFDMKTLAHKKTYKTDRPVNSAAVSPLKPHVVMGGGQEAMDVTTTSTRIGKFDARFFHLVFEEEFGRVKGHFGPINSVAFHPDGKGYSSGGEDGYVRLHTFDPTYFDFNFEC